MIERLHRGGDHTVLLKGGCVLTMDSRIGDFVQADVLIRGRHIADVKPQIDITADVTIDARGMIVLPGFVDTHRHCWQNVFRRFLPNATLESYAADIDRVAHVIRPDDVRVANLISCLGAINSGTTTMLDWSHISNTPDHSDAAISGLRQSGMRAVYGYGHSRVDAPGNRFPDDVTRIRTEHFASDDQLVTLCLAANIDRTASWRLARDLGLRITAHVLQPELLEAAGRDGLLGPDVTYIHCTSVTDDGWKMIRDSGGTLSLASPSIGQLGVGGGGIPPIQKALDHGIRPSLSVDVEVSLMSDFFTQMRTTLFVQRALANERRLRDEGDHPALLTVRDVLQFATVEGARANGLLHRIGTLTPGKEADVILLSADTISTMPLNNAIGTVVSGCDCSNVHTVFIAGRLMKADGRLVGIDEDQVRRQVYESRDWLLEKSGHRLDVLGDGA